MIELAILDKTVIIIYENNMFEITTSEESINTIKQQQKESNLKSLYFVKNVFNKGCGYNKYAIINHRDLL